MEKKPSHEGYALVFREEFDQAALSRSDWNVELHEPGWVNEEWQRYVDSEENIAVIDPALWTDPSGYNLGDPKSSYSYEPADCDNGHCKKYTLKADLEKEATYVKTNRH